MLNEILVYEGKKAREDVEREKWRRKVDGLVAKRRGWLKKEAAENIEVQLEEYRQRLLEIPVQSRRPSKEEFASRKERQQIHQQQRRKRKQQQYRESQRMWAKVGKASVRKVELNDNNLNVVYERCMVADGIDWSAEDFARK